MVKVVLKERKKEKRYLLLTYILSRVPVGTSYSPLPSVGYQKVPPTYIYCQYHKGTNLDPNLTTLCQEGTEWYHLLTSTIIRIPAGTYNLPLLS